MVRQFIFITLFPKLIYPYFDNAIIRKAIANNFLEVKVVDLREYGMGQHRNCDDVPYGGGGGMLLSAVPLGRALDGIFKEQGDKDKAGRRVVYATPSGRSFNADSVPLLLEHQQLIFICGHYEGIDQRVIDRYVDYEVSIGDYVISSGELSSLVIAEALIRHIDGTISAHSLREESHMDGMLEYPHYTRPRSWEGLEVPEVLVSGNHREINEWRMKMSNKKTSHNRGKMLQ